MAALLLPLSLSSREGQSKSGYGEEKEEVEKLAHVPGGPGKPKRTASQH